MTAGSQARLTCGCPPTHRDHAEGALRLAYSYAVRPLACGAYRSRRRAALRSAEVPNGLVDQHRVRSPRNDQDLLQVLDHHRARAWPVQEGRQKLRHHLLEALRDGKGNRDIRPWQRSDSSGWLPSVGGEHAPCGLRGRRGAARCGAAPTPRRGAWPGMRRPSCPSRRSNASAPADPHSPPRLSPSSPPRPARALLALAYRVLVAGICSNFYLESTHGVQDGLGKRNRRGSARSVAEREKQRRLASNGCTLASFWPPRNRDSSLSSLVWFVAQKTKTEQYRLNGAWAWGGLRGRYSGGRGACGGTLAWAISAAVSLRHRMRRRSGS